LISDDNVFATKVYQKNSKLKEITLVDAADNDIDAGIYKQELLLIGVENNRYSSLTGQYRVLESITTGKGEN
jgi:hypothetical protein